MNKVDYRSKIIAQEEAKNYIKDGYFALDPHCHTSYSYDVPDAEDTHPEQVVGVQKKLGLRMLVSDHDNINAYNYLRKKGHKIIPAVELTFKPSIMRKIDLKGPMHTLHINIFGLNNNDMAVLSEIAKRGDLDELVKYCKQNDLDWMYNHPLFYERGEHLNWRAVPGLAKHYFDVVELNGTFSRSMNDIALRLAENLRKGVIASSDSHTGRPGIGFVIAEGKNFKDFWENVKRGEMYVVRRDMKTLDIVKEASLMVNQTFSASTKPRKEKRFSPATNFAPFNKLATSVTSGRLKDKFILKKIIKMTLQTINYSAGPILAWKLHVTKDEKHAEYIRHRIDLLTKKLNINPDAHYKNSENKKNVKIYQKNFTKI